MPTKARSRAECAGHPFARYFKHPDWLQQVWFAGNHSDVGGSYPENEARRSDISLGWMAHAAENFPDGKTPDGFGIKLDDRFLKLNPDPTLIKKGFLVPPTSRAPVRLGFPLTVVDRWFPQLYTGPANAK